MAQTTTNPNTHLNFNLQVPKVFIPSFFD